MHTKCYQPDRFTWAFQILRPNSSDFILEIGCGTGILAELIAQKLISGKIIGIDRSEALIKKAVARNKHYIENQRAEFRTKKFTEALFPASLFDKMVAFNVSLFWKKPENEFALIRKQLKPSGKFYLFHQPPFNMTREIASEAENN